MSDGSQGQEGTSWSWSSSRYQMVHALRDRFIYIYIHTYREVKKMQFYVKKKRKRMEILFRIKWSSARERGAHPPPTRKESWKETAGLTRRRRGGGRTRGREGVLKVEGFPFMNVNNLLCILYRSKTFFV